MPFRFSLAAGVLLASFTALPLAAQQSSSGAARDMSPAKAPAARASSTDSALVELGRALTALTASVQRVVEESAKNPEVRRAALQTAGTAVTLAQRTLDENRSEIERLLTEASRKISEAAEEQKAKPAKPTKPER